MHMRGFARGLIIGGILGASVSLMMGPEMIPDRSRRRVMRTGRHLLRRSGSLMGDVIDMLM